MSTINIVGNLFNNDAYQASKRMLDLSAARHRAIASNIANASTPGYKRLDVDASFERQLITRIRNGTVNDFNSTPTLTLDPNATQTRSDGNNVQLDQELHFLHSNSTNYQALTQFVSGSLRQLKMAITGKPI
ncbi:MAG: flagellar basal body rod protein FlgB [Chthoniobacterales bacterium]|nr:flagellar basal body rod protein FlgB [Chthoniobacterales bacterium]